MYSLCCSLYHRPTGYLCLMGPGAAPVSRLLPQIQESSREQKSGKECVVVLGAGTLLYSTRLVHSGTHPPTLPPPPPQSRTCSSLFSLSLPPSLRAILGLSVSKPLLSLSTLILNSSHYTLPHLTLPLTSSPFYTLSSASIIKKVAPNYIKSSLNIFLITHLCGVRRGGLLAAVAVLSRGNA